MFPKLHEEATTVITAFKIKPKKKHTHTQVKTLKELQSQDTMGEGQNKGSHG